MSRHRYTVQYLGKFPNFVLSVQYWESSLICTANRPNYSTVQYGGKFPNSVLSVQYWRKFSTFVLSIDTIRPGGAYCVQTPDRTTVQCGAGKVSYICTVNRYYVGTACDSTIPSTTSTSWAFMDLIAGRTAPTTLSQNTARPPMMRTMWLMMSRSRDTTLLFSRTGRGEI